jgi:hypothetical protein
MKIRKYLAIASVGMSLLGGISLASMPTKVYAEEGRTSNTFKGEEVEATASAYVDDPGAVAVFSQVANSSNEYIKAKVLSVDVGKRVIYFDNNVYRGLYVNQRKDFLQHALTQIKQSNLKPKSKNKLYSFLSLQDGDASKILRNLEKDLTADIANGREVYLPFSGTVTTILGLIALGVFIGVGISMVIDISYLTLPMVQKSIDERPDGKLPKLVSSQAYFAVREREANEGSNYMLSYLKKRSIAVALVMISLGYLSSGLIFEAVGFVVQVFSEAFRN